MQTGQLNTGDHLAYCRRQSIRNALVLVKAKEKRQINQNKKKTECTSVAVTSTTVNVEQPGLILAQQASLAGPCCTFVTVAPSAQLHVSQTEPCRAWLRTCDGGAYA